MTDKRFTINTLDGSIDLRDNNEVMTYKEVVDLLNELHEENEQLKYNLSAHMVDLNNYTGKCSALEIENEQLKKQLIDCEKFRHTVFQEISKEMSKHD